MSVKQSMYNWHSPKASDYVKYRTESPNLLVLRDWLVKRYQGSSLGILNKRPVRGGTAPSTHTFGAALDWRYPTRVSAKLVMRFLVAFSEELGVQAIHDYVGNTIWHAGRGWKKQEVDSEGMGQPWATWLHIEVAPSMWKDKRSISEKVGTENLP